MNAVTRPRGLDGVLHVGTDGIWRQIRAVPHPPVLRPTPKHGRIGQRVRVLRRTVEDRACGKTLEPVERCAGLRETDCVTPWCAHAEVPAHVVEPEPLIRLDETANAHPAV